MHIAEATRLFNRYLHMRGRAAGTQRSYGYLLEQWGRWLAGNKMDWKNVTTGNLESFLEEYRETHSRTSTALFATCLKSFYRWARRKGHIPLSPADDLETIARDRPLPRALPDSQVHALLVALDGLKGTEAQRNRLIVRMLLHTGMRLSELAGLDWEDIDLAARTIQIRHAKGGRHRVTPINETLHADITAFTPQSSGPVFICSRGKLSADGISEMFRKVIQKQLGFDGVTAHKLRHTYGTKLRRKGADLRSIQMLLGHVEPRTTALYTAVYDEEMHEAAALLTANW